MKTRFYNADSAFSYFLNEIRCNGVEFGDTKALFNVGFTMEHPTDMGTKFWPLQTASLPLKCTMDIEV